MLFYFLSVIIVIAAANFFMIVIIIHVIYFAFWCVALHVNYYFYSFNKHFPYYHKTNEIDSKVAITFVVVSVSCDSHHYVKHLSLTERSASVMVVF